MRKMFTLSAAATALALAACGGGGGNQGHEAGTDLNEQDMVVPPGNVTEAPTGQGPTVNPAEGTATFDNGSEVQLNGTNGSGNATGGGATAGNQTGR